MDKVECQDCGWKGELDECNCKFDEIKPLCPKCGSDRLLDIDQERVLV